MKTQVQKAAWVAVAILLAGLSVTAIWQAQAISRLQNGTTTSKTFESVPYWPSDRDRIAALEQERKEREMRGTVRDMCLQQHIIC